MLLKYGKVGQKLTLLGQTKKAIRLKGVENDMPLRSIQICLRPGVTLTSDLLHPSCCDANHSAQKFDNT